ncbi:PDDEXK nuclease domain-containing protein [Butyrivibrio sp. LB2008]|uniref:PDDEXK nuclease domain-containing protein n=1 Tax=Butyrivibrio sp. LB2008 TaxID=1408305 RepID=UPI000AE742D4|nr:PDDEXK nuclease domain-containing protein [Butyrivibrio sp. LB2008]
MHIGIFGKQIYEACGENERAEYGKQLLKYLSDKLTREFGKGFDESNLRNMRRFYNIFPIRDALRPELSWTRYRSLMRVEDEEARAFYFDEAVKCGWSSRQLDRQINSFYYQRILASKDKKSVSEEINELEPKPEYEKIIKDPYVLEFLDLPANEHFYVEGRHFYIDLVFYNYILKCFVLIDLKIGDLTHQDLGQMQMYVNYYTRNMMNEGDNPPIGIVLCADKSDTLVEYTLPEDNKQIFAAKYLPYMPTKDELKRELNIEDFEKKDVD